MSGREIRMSVVVKPAAAPIIAVLLLWAPASVSAAPTAVTKTQDLQFGQIACDSGVSGSVTIDTTGSRMVSGSVKPLGSAYAPAQFVITGNVGQTYTLTLPTEFPVTSVGAAMTVTSLSASIGSTGVIPASGSLQFVVGGTLLVNGAQQSGAYSGSLTVTVK